MTITEPNPATVDPTALELVALDLYRDIHKGIRAELFATCEAAGRVDPSDAVGRAALAGQVDQLVALLVSHAEHEDSHMQPTIEAHLPAEAEQIAADHDRIERRMDVLVDLAQVQAGDLTTGRTHTHRLYLELASFTAAYLEHQDLEERIVMPALDRAVGKEACVAMNQAIVGSIPPEEMARSLASMLPAMNVEDRTELLGGMQAGAPAEVFAGVWSLAGSVLWQRTPQRWPVASACPERIAEHDGRPRRTVVPVIPVTPEAVTPAWLTEILRPSFGDDLEVREVSLQPLGTGQMADSYRAWLETHGPADVPRSVVVKLPSTDPTSRSTALGLRAYEKEVRFYQHLAPHLGVRAPRCFHAEIDVATADFVLVLADLHPASQGDQLTGCSVEVAASALDQLVALHAPWWGETIAEHEDWLVGDRALAREVSLMILPGLWQGFVERYRAQLDATVLRAGDVLFTQLGSYLDTGDAALTVVHGDFRLDNLLIDADRPEVVGVVDWQTCTQAPALRDVAYMLGAGLMPEVRREAERELVGRYHAGLADAGVADLSWEWCWDGYRRGTWAGLVMAVGASMMVVRTDRGDEMFLAMAHRHALHALDLGADELLAS